MELNDKIAARRRELTQEDSTSHTPNGVGFNDVELQLNHSVETTSNKIQEPKENSDGLGVFWICKNCGSNCESASDAVIDECWSCGAKVSLVDENASGDRKESPKEAEHSTMDLQAKINERRNELDAKAENNYTDAVKLMEKDGIDISSEAIRRISVATYGSLIIWLILAFNLLFNHETFDGSNATIGGVILIGIISAFFFAAVTKNKNDMVSEYMSTSTVTKFGIMDNLRATSPWTYVSFSVILLVFFSVAFDGSSS